MTRVLSISEVLKSQWDYLRPGPGRSGRSLSENNFAKERRDWLSILLREILQNALDAGTPNTPVTVALKVHSLDAEGKAFVAHLLPPEHLARFQESVPQLRIDSVPSIQSCLVVEDFGTCGLTGTFDNPDRDGSGENWNGFWFREGEGGKEGSSGNGGAGQGKITYFSTSGIRTIFAYTVRSTDGQQAIFGSSSFMRDYSYMDIRWKRDAYWGRYRGEGLDRIHMPDLTSETIGLFREHFHLERDSSKPGLSLIIPSPKTVSMDEAIEITIAEFFVPIYRGDLIVNIGGTVLDKGTISALADEKLSDERARALHTCTTKGFRDFLERATVRSQKNEVVVAKVVTKAGEYSDASFDAADLDAMRSAIGEEGLISVRVPVPVKTKKGEVENCYFDVHLECPYGLEYPEQAIVRKDLLIGEEPVGGGKLRQRVRGVTLIQDTSLSRLLLTAEEATHLRWNTRLPRLSEYYRSGPEVVAVVRNAMTKILDVLTGGDQKKDFKLLAKYFSAPGAIPTIPTKGKKSSKGKNELKTADIPPPKPKLLSIKTEVDGCLIQPAKADALLNSKLPISVTAEFAYEGLDKDAFSEYDPLDFDLDDKEFLVSCSGCQIDQRGLNQVSFSISSPNFSFRINGFDKNLRLRVRVNYKEVEDATLIDAE